MARDFHMLIDGRWMAGNTRREVKNKYNGSVLGTVPMADEVTIDHAIAAAQRAFPMMAALPAYKRAEILGRVVGLLQQRREEIARTIAAEAGKALKFARAEADRGMQTFTFAAEEAKRMHGETVPLDAAPAGAMHMGFYLRVPVGVVVAISPFNFPLNLVAHKVAPALAAGNTVVLKPATTTPLTAVILGEVFVEAGLPAGALNIIFGDGRTVGDQLVADPRPAKVTFTGSPSVGRHIMSRAGLKKITLELGNSSPTIIDQDADLAVAVPKCVVGSFYNAGQVCLSVQRIYVQRRIEQEFTERFVSATAALKLGDPLDEECDVGPMIDESEAVRAEAWIQEAVGEGAKVLIGGKREGALLHPTVLTNATPTMKVVCSEVFAPVVSILPFDDFDEALYLANDTPYGLQAGVFCRDVHKVWQAVKGLEFGGVIINDVPTFRADHMPYGGVKESGIGREGLRYAIEEMTHIKMVAFNLA